MPHKKQFGKRVKALREAKKLSREKFCKTHDLDMSNLLNIEHGRTNVKLDTINKIAVGLKVEIKSLFDSGDDNEG